jgi:hypothetical protein
VGSGLATAWNYTGGEVVHWTAEGVAAAWNWVYDNASTISTGAGDLALFASAIPAVGEIAGPILGGVAAVTGAIAAYKDAKDGNYVLAALDSLGAVLGAGGATQDALKPLLEDAATEAWDAGNLTLAQGAAHSAEFAESTRKVLDRLSATLGTLSYAMS